jgi:hypothetical protein
MKTITALCFVIGLAMAMSEGPYFPWVNLGGVGLFALTPALAGRW